jgi:transcriptional regulator with XRE-family HTH domain
MMKFNEQLKAARKAAKITQAQAALKVGRPLPTIRKWEQDGATPDMAIQIDVLTKLSK